MQSKKIWFTSFPELTSCWNLIEQNYSQGYYHSLSHVEEMLTTSDLLRDLARSDKEALRIAIICHDLFPDVSRSARLAYECARYAGWTAARQEYVSRLVLCTKDHVPFDTEDSAVIIDCDLFRFTSESLPQYTDLVRLEYSQYPDKAFNKGRADILESYLVRPNIFHTWFGRKVYEPKARANLINEIERLRHL